jgi:RHS repeat-associated protein
MSMVRSDLACADVIETVGAITPWARRYRLVIAAVASSSLLLLGPGALAQQAAANPDQVAAKRIESALVRITAGSFGTAAIVDGACARAGGREAACWTAIGTPASKRAITDGIVANVLRKSGIPADAVAASSPSPVDFGPPPLEIATTDMVVAVGAVSLPLQRVLASSGTGTGAGYLGKRWRLNWENRISRNAGGYAISEGAQEIKFVSKDGGFIGPPGERVVMDAASGAPVRIRGDLTRDGYDAQGRLAWRDFGNGNRAVLQYDGAGRLARVEGPRGSFLAFTFNGGRLTRVASSTGESVSYEYSSNELAGVETPTGPMVRYAYQGDRLARIEQPAIGPIVLSYDANGRLTRRQFADGTSETWTYDSASGLTRRTDAWGAETSWTTSADRRRLTRIGPDGSEVASERDADGRVIAVTRAGGRAVRLAYDAAGRLAQVQTGGGSTIRFGYLGKTALVDAIIGPDGTRQAFDYDAVGNLLGATVAGNPVGRQDYTPSGQVAKRLVVDEPERRFEYDAQGRLVARIDALDHRTVFEYDARGRLARQVDASGVSVSYAYDDKNRLVAETDAKGGVLKFSYDPAGRLVAKIGRDGSRESYEYDASGRRVATVDAVGRRSEVKPNPAQREIEQYFVDGSARRTRVDALGRPLEWIDNRGRGERYQYDASGHVVVAQDSVGRVRTWEYDARGHLVEAADGLGGVLRYQWSNGSISSITDASGATVRLTRDAQGRLIESIDAAGGSSRYEYDESGRPVATTAPSGESVRLDYDAAGGLAAVQQPSGGATRLARDAQGRVTVIMHPDNATFRHRYDEAGNRIAVTDPQGRNIEFSYDAAGHLIGKKLPDGTAVTYHYGAAGRLTAADDGRFPVQRTFDANGRVTSINWISLGRSLSLAYDEVGRVTELVGSAGQPIRYGYDRASRLGAIALPDGSQIDLLYDAGNRLTQVRFPNGVRGDYRYGATGRLESLAWAKADGSTLASWAYRYDTRGNVVAVDRGPAPRLEYRHDADGRLIEERAGARVAQYEYRPGGDRTKVKQSGTETAYGYDKDRLVSVGGERLDYDAAGDVVQRSGAGSSTQYHYDGEGRLVAATPAPGAQVTFAYDAFGDRVARRDAHGTSYFLQHDRQLIEEIAESGATTAFYVYAPGIDHPLAMLRDGKTYFYHADAIGSIALLTDAEGKVAASYDTDAFGQLMSPLPALANPFIFAAREYEPALRLYYNRARYYDPALGRFLSPDPIFGNPRDPASYNRYAYAANAPTRFTDPLGLAPNDTLQVGPGGKGGNTLAVPKPSGPPPAPPAPAATGPVDPYAPGMRTRPPPDYRITDYEGMGVEKSVVDELVQLVKAKILANPKYVSDHAVNEVENEFGSSDFPDWHYNKGAPPSGEQLEADANYLVERAIGLAKGPTGKVNLDRVRESLNTTQDPPGWQSTQKNPNDPDDPVANDDPLGGDDLTDVASNQADPKRVGKNQGDPKNPDPPDRTVDQPDPKRAGKRVGDPKNTDPPDRTVDQPQPGQDVDPQAGVDTVPGQKPKAGPEDSQAGVDTLRGRQPGQDGQGTGGDTLKNGPGPDPTDTLKGGTPGEQTPGGGGGQGTQTAGTDPAAPPGQGANAPPAGTDPAAPPGGQTPGGGQNPGQNPGQVAQADPPPSGGGGGAPGGGAEPGPNLAGDPVPGGGGGGGGGGATPPAEGGSCPAPTSRAAKLGRFGMWLGAAMIGVQAAQKVVEQAKREGRDPNSLAVYGQGVLTAWRDGTIGVVEGVYGTALNDYNKALSEMNQRIARGEDPSKVLAYLEGTLRTAWDLSGAGSIAEACQEAIGTIQALSEEDLTQKNQNAQDLPSQLAISDAMRKCNYSGALALARVLQQQPNPPSWLPTILPNLEAGAKAQAAVDGLLGQASLTSFASLDRKSQLLEQASAAAGDFPCLIDKVNQASPAGLGGQQCIFILDVSHGSLFIGSDAEVASRARCRWSGGGDCDAEGKKPAKVLKKVGCYPDPQAQFCADLRALPKSKIHHNVLIGDSRAELYGFNPWIGTMGPCPEPEKPPAVTADWWDPGQPVPPPSYAATPLPPPLIMPSHPVPPPIIVAYPQPAAPPVVIIDRFDPMPPQHPQPGGTIIDTWTPPPMPTHPQRNKPIIDTWTPPPMPTHPGSPAQGVKPAQPGGSASVNSGVCGCENGRNVCSDRFGNKSIGGHCTPIAALPVQPAPGTPGGTSKVPAVTTLPPPTLPTPGTPKPPAVTTLRPPTLPTPGTHDGTPKVPAVTTLPPPTLGTPGGTTKAPAVTTLPPPTLPPPTPGTPGGAPKAPAVTTLPPPTLPPPTLGTPGGASKAPAVTTLPPPTLPPPTLGTPGGASKAPAVTTLPPPTLPTPGTHDGKPPAVTALPPPTLPPPTLPPPTLPPPTLGTPGGAPKAPAVTTLPPPTLAPPTPGTHDGTPKVPAVTTLPPTHQPAPTAPVKPVVPAPNPAVTTLPPDHTPSAPVRETPPVHSAPPTHTPPVPAATPAPQHVAPPQPNRPVATAPVARPVAPPPPPKPASPPPRPAQTAQPARSYAPAAAAKPAQPNCKIVNGRKVC